MLETIKHKSFGPLVKAAKYLTGYSAINKATDDYDANFVAHVISWQKNNKLTPDGVIGSKSWTKMAETAPLCKTSNKYKKSVYTNALQEILGTIVADGIYGSKTKAAVSTFQHSVGLSADGVCGPATWNALICGIDIPKTEFKQPVDYKQGDSRWGSKMYSSHNDKSQTMKNSGCGPTAMANIVATLVDPSVNPYTLAELSMKWGTRTHSNGTAWPFFKKVFENYHISKYPCKGFTDFSETSSIATAKACLDAGGYVVCSMGPGYWTKGGHFITMWKYDGVYIYCNDPASSTRKKQNETDFMKQRKRFFCFWAKVV